VFSRLRIFVAGLLSGYSQSIRTVLVTSFARIRCSPYTFLGNVKDRI
jgi:hypothetical protein